jgi:probable F420-dependent oxidoreductase
MKVYAGMSDRLSLRDTGEYAQRVERLGYDGLLVPETIHDAMAVALLALEHTTTLQVRTSLVLAFPRSPMILAYTAWDLALMSGGRFDLGLGTQIKQNVEDRFSVKWSDPIGMMREYVESVRAIWHTFITGDKLMYEGDHYRFTRLQPFFNPGPLPEGVTAPAIWLGGVNPKAVALGASHADGFVTHPTNSNPRYLDEICIPAFRGGDRYVELVTSGQLMMGKDRTAVDASREQQRAVLAFLYSTPAYRRTLELYGWTELGERLQAMTRASAWDQLQELMTDDVLDALIPQGTWAEMPAIVEEWFASRCDGLLLQVPSDPADDAEFAEVIAAIRAIPTTTTATAR